MIPRDAAAGLAVTTALALVGPVALARGADPSAFVEGQRLAGVWYAVLQPVPLAVLAVAAALALNAARAGRAPGVAVAAVLTIVFFGGWSSPAGGLPVAVVLFAAKSAAVAWGFERLRRRVGDLDPYRASVRALGPAAFASATITSVALSAALAVRTPMGQGILAGASGSGLWVGWLGLAYFGGVAAVSALVALGAARALREPAAR